MKKLLFLGDQAVIKYKGSPRADYFLGDTEVILFCNCLAALSFNNNVGMKYLTFSSSTEKRKNGDRTI